MRASARLPSFRFVGNTLEPLRGLFLASDRARSSNAPSKSGDPEGGKRITLKTAQPSTLLGEHDFHGDQPWRTLLGVYWPERGQLLLSGAFWFVKSSPVWLMPIITANVIDFLTVPGRHPLSSLWWNAFWGTLCILQNVPTHIWHNNALSLAVRRAETRLRSALCRHLQQLSISYYKHTSAGLLQSKVMRDVENIGLATRELFNNGLYSICTVIITLAVTAIRAPWFVPIFLLATPLVVALRSVLRRRLGSANHHFRREFEGLAARLLGMLNMIPVTRAHAVEDDEIAQVENRLGQVQVAGLRLDMQNGVVNAASWVTLTQFSLVGSDLQRLAQLPQNSAADRRRRGAHERLFQHAHRHARDFPEHAAHHRARF